MSAPALWLRRPLSWGSLAVLVWSLPGTLHRHDVDHDGASSHVEAAHGAHLPTLSETDSRVRPDGPQILAGAAVTRAPLTPSGDQGWLRPATRDEASPPTRAPPERLRSRAPPA